LEAVGSCCSLSIFVVSGPQISVSVLTLFCLPHAARRGHFAVGTLLAGMIYGVPLEHAAIQLYEAYTYGQFLITFFGAVPLCIGVRWAYSTKSASKALGIPLANLR